MRTLLSFGVVVSCLTIFDSMATEMCMLSNYKQVPADRSLDHFDDFSYRMIKDMGREMQGNVIHAPFSVAIFMTELAVISESKYQKELLPALGFSAWNRTEILGERFRQNKRFDKSGRYNLLSANRLFVSDLATDRILKTECLFQNCQFEIDSTAAIENVVGSWVTKQSNSNIIRVQVPHRDLPIVAVNVVSYTGEWLYKFNRSETRVRKFWSTPQTYENVPMMHAFGNFFHGDLPGFDARIIRLPFLINDLEDTNMWIILPNEKNGLYRLTEDLYTVMTCARLWTWMEEEPMDVYLPIVKMDSTYDLKPSMERLGVAKSFFEDGNFRNEYVKVLPTVEKFIQGTYINIDENGFSDYRYSAFNSWNYNPLNYWESDILEPNFNVDRPFVWVIMGYNGAPLLSGIFRTPMSAEDMLQQPIIN